MPHSPERKPYKPEPAQKQSVYASLSPLVRTANDAFVVATHSGFEAAGLDAGSAAAFSLSPGGGGMVMSTVVTCPSDDNGLSNSDVFPTTNTTSWSLCRYLAATRATSSVCTFSIPARYFSRKSAGYP